MRRLALIGLVGVLSLLFLAPPALADWGHRGFHHSHVRTSFGFHFFFPFYPAYVAPYPYYPYSYPYSPYYYYPPPAYSYAPAPQVPAEIGYLQLQIEPREAHIYLDGKYVGPVQQFSGGTVALAPGAHQVAIVAWGYRPFQMEVQITLGATSAVRVVLERDPTAPMPPPAAQGSPQGGGYQVAPREETR